MVGIYQLLRFSERYFCLLGQKEIGTELALYYEEFAKYLELNEKFQDATQIYEMGLNIRQGLWFDLNDHLCNSTKECMIRPGEQIEVNRP